MPELTVEHCERSGAPELRSYPQDGWDVGRERRRYRTGPAVLVEIELTGWGENGERFAIEWPRFFFEARVRYEDGRGGWWDVAGGPIPTEELSKRGHRLDATSAAWEYVLTTVEDRL